MMNQISHLHLMLQSEIQPTLRRVAEMVGLSRFEDIILHLYPWLSDPYVGAVCGLSIVVILVLILRCPRKIRAKDRIKAVKAFVAPGEGPRFRKRDRFEFIKRKAMRNAQAVGVYIRGGQGRKRRDVVRLVKKVFQPKGSPDLQSLMLRPELPRDFLEEDGHIGESESNPLPEALMLVLKNLRVFGHIDNAILLEVMKSMDTLYLRKDDTLFKVGDADENMYIVEKGKIRIFYGSDAHEHMELKDVSSGEPIISLLSFIDHLAGKRKCYKTVTAKAMKDTKVIKFSFECFRQAFVKFPASLSRVVQVMMVRLQRVTLLSLHQYLGLGTQLVNVAHRGNAVTRQQSTGDDVISTRAITDGTEETQSAQHNAYIHELNHILKSNQKLTDFTDAELKMFAIEMFKQKLNITAEDMDEQVEAALNAIEIQHLDQKYMLVEEDSSDRNILVLVLTGCVGVFQKEVDSEVITELHKAYPGGYLGQLQVLTMEPSFFTYTCLERSKIACLNGEILRQIMFPHPKIAVELATSIIDHLSTYVRSIDFALEWSFVESGRALYKQGSVADSTYVILSGRLRSVVTKKDGKREMVGEYGRGELTGIVETLLKSPRSTTVIAVRDTEIAKLPAGLIDMIKIKFPNILMRLIKLLGSKLQQSWEKIPDTASTSVSSKMLITPQSNLSTVAVIGLSADVPVTSFTYELVHAVSRIGPCMRLTRDEVLREVGDDAFEKTADFRLSAWLGQQEDKNQIVVYQCDLVLNSWTRLCIRHADVILILVDPSSPTPVTPLEDSMEHFATRTRKDLIFLHPETTEYPRNTAQWLKHRNWVNAHHHIKCPKRMFFKKKPERLDERYRRVMMGPATDLHSDFARLARYITGNTVGLVLGGGGARGCSHVGMIRAIQEAGIPIDSVAGVSIGSFIGALWCQERDIAKLTLKSRTFSQKMSQMWRQVLDLTYPITSYFSGHGFNALIEEAFEKRDITDLWLPFFTITTDITESSMRIHDYGSLWRYVRSSMSLAGYMPPLCDPHDGHLLLDGGYVNNLPADIMRLRGAKHILAIDVGGESDMQFTNYGDFLSGFSVMISKWSPFRTSMVVPNQAEIQSRLAYVSCVRTLELVKNSDYCDYIRPPIDRFGTLQFGSFDEIKDVGYYHGKTYFSGLLKAGLLTQIFTPSRPEGFTLAGENSDEEAGNLNLPTSMRRRVKTKGRPRQFSFDENFSNEENFV